MQVSPRKFVSPERTSQLSSRFNVSLVGAGKAIDFSVMDTVVSQIKSSTHYDRFKQMESSS